jgi:integrative and conjugative element protein (TIGR02256 family)
MIEYPIGNSGQSILLCDGVLAHFARHRQVRCWHREAGGQLFARDSSEQLVIELATGPRKTDRRSRMLYIPDRSAERAEIVKLHAQGLHFVGDWHTHPQKVPHYSTCDGQNIADCFEKSVHQMNCFVLIIVGQIPAPEGLEVSLHSADKTVVLSSRKLAALAPNLISAPGRG